MRAVHVALVEVDGGLTKRNKEGKVMGKAVEAVYKAPGLTVVSSILSGF